MDYNDIPLFLRVVESGGFTAAATALGIQKSSLSRSVSRLERELGVRLLQRTTRKLSLTEAGQAYYERVRGALAGVDEATDVVRELGEEPRGIVRISATPDSDAIGLDVALARFCEKYPGIHVECAFTVRRVDLIAEGFDLAVRGGKLDDSTLVARRIGAPPVLAFAAPAYLRRRGRPKTLADLAQHDCVLFRARGGRATWTLTGPRGAESVEVSGRISVDDMTFALHACSAGLGIALIPAPTARAAAEQGEIELVLSGYMMSYVEVHVVLPSARFVPARVALLRDHLVAELGRHIAESTQQCSKHHQRKAP